MNIINYLRKEARTICASSFLIIISVLPAYSEIVYTENFDYPIGDLLSAHGWEAFSTGSSPISITNGLSFPGYPGSDIGGAAVIDANGEDVRHAFDRPITKGSAYVAFMGRVSWSDKASYFVSLWDGTVSYTVHNYHGRVYANSDGQVGLSFADNQKSEYSSSSFFSPEGKTYLFIIRYDIVPGNNNDQVRLYVLDEITKNEPETATIGPLSDATKPDVLPNGFVLRQYSDGQQMVIDGIRAATSWEEAVGITSGIVPTSKNSSFSIDRTTNGLEINLEEAKDIILYNITGQIVKRLNGNIGKNSIMNLYRGIYILRIGNETVKISL